VEPEQEVAMDGQRVQSTGIALRDRATLPRRESLQQRFVAPAGQLPLHWAIALGVGWPFAVIAGTALEPAPAHAHAATPLVVSVVSVAALAGIYATVFLALRRHPHAAAVGGGTGVILMAMSAACPLSGHHAFGLWWVAQFGLIVTMLAVSLVALRASGPGGPRATVGTTARGRAGE
jgi:hypothetical protein